MQTATISATSVEVVLLGCGLVGKAVLKRLAAVKGKPYSFVVRGVAESDYGAISAEWSGINTTELLKLKQDGGRIKDMDPLSQPAGTAVLPMSDFVERLPGLAPRRILIDCSATDATVPHMLAWVAGGGSVVMANKKPLTGPQADFASLVSSTGDTCGYESTVGAGTPFVAALRRLVEAGDEVESVMGTFSGTLGFLMAGLQAGEKGWGALVNEAHDLGYTEPDPRDDLSGSDVARKALIMARTLGWTFEMSDIQIEALFPSDLKDMSVPEFKAAIGRLDDEMKAKRDAADADGKVLRYVASCSEAGLRVGLEAVPKDSPLGLLSGPDNMMVVKSTLYADRPLVVQGAGAGDDVTAAGVVADCVAIARTARLVGSVVDQV